MLQKSHIFLSSVLFMVQCLIFHIDSDNFVGIQKYTSSDDRSKEYLVLCLRCKYLVLTDPPRHLVCLTSLSHHHLPLPPLPCILQCFWYLQTALGINILRFDYQDVLAISVLFRGYEVSKIQLLTKKNMCFMNDMLIVIPYEYSFLKKKNWKPIWTWIHDIKGWL